ncbi:tyrosine-type recombinase/integrase [Hyphomonas sp.]|uniref:tyrosine-type recombinase/integrase n=1 Tax=Hyphomonas sp. TaxID=87 RepID=UPI00391D925A
MTSSPRNSPSSTPGSPRLTPKAPLRLPGAHRVVKRSRVATRIFWYAWRGGPQVAAFAGTTDAEAFAAESAGAPALAAAWSDTAFPKPSAATFEGLAAAFRASPAFLSLAPSTRALWGPAIGKAVATFGPVSLKAMQAPGIRARIKQWHAGMAATPRAANIHLQVLGRILEWGVDEERLTRNAARGIAHLDEGPGRADILITEAEFKALCLAAGPGLARTLEILWHTGLRRQDLVELTWAEVDARAGHIVRRTNKSGGRRAACPPLTPALKKALGRRGAPHARVCRRDDGNPWTDGRQLRKAFEAAKVRAAKTLKTAGDKAALMQKHLHDFRGTCITRGYADGASDIDMEIRMGWAPGEGAAMRAIYGSQAQLARAAAARVRPRKKA